MTTDGTILRYRHWASLKIAYGRFKHGKKIIIPGTLEHAVQGVFVLINYLGRPRKEAQAVRRRRESESVEGVGVVHGGFLTIKSKKVRPQRVRAERRGHGAHRAVRLLVTRCGQTGQTTAVGNRTHEAPEPIGLSVAMPRSDLRSFSLAIRSGSHPLRSIPSRAKTSQRR